MAIENALPLGLKILRRFQPNRYNKYSRKPNFKTLVNGLERCAKNGKSPKCDICRYILPCKNKFDEIASMEKRWGSACVFSGMRNIS